MKSIAILMSTYNGSRYIKEQLNSLINQKISNNYKITIIVRDDGSKDNTTKIISEFQHTYNNIICYYETNIGWKKSFWRLLKLADKYDYYAYCDQDDIWKSDKILNAIMRLKKYEGIPALYLASTDIIDSKGDYLYTEPVSLPDNKLKYLTCLKGRGCCMVFNDSLKLQILRSGPPECFAHDLWTLKVASFIGKIIVDNQPQIFYREHNDSATYSKKIINRIKYSLKKYKSLENSYFYYALFLIKYYSDLIEPKTKSYLQEVLKAHSSIFYKLKLLFDKNFVAQSIWGTCEMKIFMLTNYCQHYSITQLNKNNMT